METIIPWILQHIPELNKDLQKKLLVEVALEEIFVNIMLHAYHKKELPIFCILKETQNSYELTFKDFGPKFDPKSLLEKAEKAKAISTIGGSGLKLIKAAFSNIQYSVHNDLNTLVCTLFKF